MNEVDGENDVWLHSKMAQESGFVDEKFLEEAASRESLEALLWRIRLSDSV